MRTIFYLFVALLFSVVTLKSANFDGIKKGLNNIGTEFLFTFHPAQDKLNKETNIKIYVMSDVSSEVTVAINANNIIETKSIEPYQITEFVIDPSKAIPVIQYPYIEPDDEKIYANYAIRVNSTEPVMCYAVLDFDKNKGAIAPLATSAIGTEYLVSTYPDDQSQEIRLHTSYVSVVGVHTNTTVYFTLGGTLGSETAGGLSSGETMTVTLNSGDVWLIPGAGTKHDLSGSLITSSKPVAVLSGIYSYPVSSSTAATDYTIEQLMPIDSWGKNNLIPEFSDWQSNPYVNIFASEDNTNIYLNDDLIFNLLKRNGEQNTGYLGRDLFRNTTLSNPALVSSEKNIHVSMFPNYSNYDYGVSEQIEILPLNQYENNLIFFTPPLKTSTLKYNMTLIFETDQAGNIPATLQLGEYNSEMQGFDYRNVLDLQYLSFKHIADIEDKSYAYCTVQIPNNKVFRVNSPSAVIAYISDSRTNKSGAMPAQFNSKRNFLNDENPPIITYKNINKEDKIQFTLSDSPSNTFESSKLSMIDFSETSSSNFDFYADSFLPRISHSISGYLQVIDYTKDAYAEIYAIDAAGNDTVLTFSYYTPKFEVTSEDEFGKYSIFDEQVDSKIKITNLSESDELTIESIFLKSKISGFSIADNSEFPKTIPAGGEAIVSITFDPARDKGNYSDRLAVIIDGREYIKYEFSAEVAAPSITVNDLDFGNVVEGETSFAYKLEVKNIGDYAAKITDMQLSTNSFRIENVEFPLQVEPDSKLEFNVYFEPKASGKIVDTLLVLGQFLNIPNTSKEYAVLQGSGLVSSIDEAPSSGIEITNVSYEAPNTLFVNLNSRISDNAAINLVDLSGNLITENNIILTEGLNTFNIAIPNSAQGVYLLNLSIGNISITKKIIIQK